VLLATMTSADGIKTTNVTVVAHEYYDEYQLPDKKKWQQVRRVRIEGQSSVGSIQVEQSGPSTELEVTLYDVAVPSEYWVTIVWQGGERYRQSFSTSAQKETRHDIYQPF